MERRSFLRAASAGSLVGGPLGRLAYAQRVSCDAVEHVEQLRDPYAVSADLEKAIIEAESLQSRLPQLNVLAAKHSENRLDAV